MEMQSIVKSHSTYFERLTHLPVKKILITLIEDLKDGGNTSAVLYSRIFRSHFKSVLYLHENAGRKDKVAVASQILQQNACSETAADKLSEGLLLLYNSIESNVPSAEDLITLAFSSVNNVIATVNWY